MECSFSPREKVEIKILSTGMVSGWERLLFFTKRLQTLFYDERQFEAIEKNENNAEVLFIMLLTHPTGWMIISCS